jgi:hypothetical protein
MSTDDERASFQASEINKDPLYFSIGCDTEHMQSKAQWRRRSF